MGSSDNNQVDWKDSLIADARDRQASRLAVGWRPFRHSVREFCAVYRALNRRSELERLLAWAARKRLSGPRRLYEKRYADVERALFRYGRRSPHLVNRARVLHWIGRLINKPPRYPSRGAAAGYKYGQT